MLNTYTLLYCRDEEDVFGNFLFFESVREGFPESNITVISNANEDHFNEQAKELCESISANYIIFPDECTHHGLIDHLLKTETQPFYLIDPDTIWYSPMPQEYDAAIAGRYISAFFDVYHNANTFPRLHTSCLYLDPIRIRTQLDAAERNFEFNPVDPALFHLDDVWYRHDTLSKMYGLLKCVNEVEVFDEEVNKKFSHLFCGTHLSLVGKSIRELKEANYKVRQDRNYARQMQMMQEEYFTNNPWI